MPRGTRRSPRRSAPETLRATPIVVRLGVVLLEPDGRAELGDRFLNPLQGRQGDAEIVMGRRVVGLKSNGLAELVDRLVDPPLVFQGGAELAVSDDVAGRTRIA